MGRGYGVAVATLPRLGLAVAAAALLVSCRCAAQVTTAPLGGGGGGNGCMPELVSLAPCMGYMSGNGTTAAPGAPCCSALSGMLGSSPGCLCVVLGGNAATLGVAVDGDRVLRLPVACRVQTPTASQCDSAGASLPTPATPSDPNTTSGSKATPTAQYSGENASKAGKLLSTFIAIVGVMSFIHGG